MFPSRPENPWNPAQQPGLGIYHRFTVSNGVFQDTAPEAAAIAAAIELAAAIGITAAKKGGKGDGGIGSCFPVIMMYGIPLRLPLRLPLRWSFGRCDTYHSGSGCFCSVFPLQGLSCG